MGPAIVQLRRAQLMAPNSPYQALVTLTLAAAYLGDSRCEQTRLLLAGRRALLQQEPYKSTSAFPGRFCPVPPGQVHRAGRREASDLLSTLWRDQENDVLGIVGQYLKAQAYRDIGFWDQAEKLLRAAAKDAHRPMSVALEYLLAETLQQQNRAAEARALFEKLAAERSAYQPRARLQLAHRTWRRRSSTNAPANARAFGSSTRSWTMPPSCNSGVPLSKAPATSPKPPNASPAKRPCNALQAARLRYSETRG